MRHGHGRQRRGVRHDPQGFVPGSRGGDAGDDARPPRPRERQVQGDAVQELRDGDLRGPDHGAAAASHHDPEAARAEGGPPREAVDGQAGRVDHPPLGADDAQDRPRGRASAHHRWRAGGGTPLQVDRRSQLGRNRGPPRADLRDVVSLQVHGDAHRMFTYWIPSGEGAPRPSRTA